MSSPSPLYAHLNSRYGLKARRRLSVVSDNRLIEGCADPKRDHHSGDGISGRVGVGISPGGAGEPGAGVLARAGVGMERQRPPGAYLLGYPLGGACYDTGEEHDSDNDEEEDAIPCIVSR